MSTEWMSLADEVIASTYKRFPIVLVQGSGCRLTDTEERTYIDFVAGIAVCNLGHAHPRVTRAVCDQAGRLTHVSNLYYTRPQIELAQWLVRRSFAQRVFFCNSGAEANEAAIKLARKHFKEAGQPQRYRIVTALRSFHGRTMGALAATGQEKIRKGFDPILEGFDFVPFNDIEALHGAVGSETAAVLLEPIQGEGGVRVPAENYLSQVRQLCDHTGTLLIYDEIQTGIGRTGRLFAHEHFEAAPDIMTLAKALANGLPIGAMLATESVASAFGPGAHATTFGGTPLVTAAALETLYTIEAENLVDHCAKTGAYFKSRLEELKKRHDSIIDIRGMGLLLGMKMDLEVAPIVTACMTKGFLVNGVQEKILRFAPPLIVTTAEIDALISCLDEVIGEI